MNCSAKSQRKLPFCNFRVSFCVGVIFRSGLDLLFLSVASSIVRRTLYDLYLSVFLSRSDGELNEKEHFITLIDSGMHLIEHKLGRISSKECKWSVGPSVFACGLSSLPAAWLELNLFCDLCHWTNLAMTKRQLFRISRSLWVLLKDFWTSKRISPYEKNALFGFKGTNCTCDIRYRRFFLNST